MESTILSTFASLVKGSTVLIETALKNFKPLVSSDNPTDEELFLAIRETIFTAIGNEDFRRLLEMNLIKLYGNWLFTEHSASSYEMCMCTARTKVHELLSISNMTKLAMFIRANDDEIMNIWQPVFELAFSSPDKSSLPSDLNNAFVSTIELLKAA